jgi:hypothetical protein
MTLIRLLVCAAGAYAIYLIALAVHARFANVLDLLAGLS